MKIEQIPTERLIPYARNAKKHDAAQVSKLAGSIREFGFNNPVLIDRDNGIIAGHGRVMAAQQLDLKDVPCIRLGHLTDNQRKAYILADNRLAEIGGGWDEKMLKVELESIGMDESWLNFNELFEKELTNNDSEEVSPEVEFSYDLMLSHNYIVLYFDTAMDWEVAKERFKLKDVKSGDPAEKCQKVGIARVLPGKDFI
jgi:hypothetical protein